MTQPIGYQPVPYFNGNNIQQNSLPPVKAEADLTAANLATGTALLAGGVYTMNEGVRKRVNPALLKTINGVQSGVNKVADIANNKLAPTAKATEPVVSGAAEQVGEVASKTVAKVADKVDNVAKPVVSEVAEQAGKATKKGPLAWVGKQIANGKIRERHFGVGSLNIIPGVHINPDGKAAKVVQNVAHAVADPMLGFVGLQEAGTFVAAHQALAGTQVGGAVVQAATTAATAKTAATAAIANSQVGHVATSAGSSISAAAGKLMSSDAGQAIVHTAGNVKHAVAGMGDTIVQRSIQDSATTTKFLAGQTDNLVGLGKKALGFIAKATPWA